MHLDISADIWRSDFSWGHTHSEDEWQGWAALGTVDVLKLFLGVWNSPIYNWNRQAAKSCYSRCSLWTLCLSFYCFLTFFSRVSFFFVFSLKIHHKSLQTRSFNLQSELVVAISVLRPSQPSSRFPAQHFTESRIRTTYVKRSPPPTCFCQDTCYK